MDLKRFQEYLQEEERRARYMEAPSSLVSQLDGNQSKSQYSLDRDTSHLSFGTTEPPSFSTVHSQFQSGESQRDITQDAKIMAALVAVAAGLCPLFFKAVFFDYLSMLFKLILTCAIF